MDFWTWDFTKILKAIIGLVVGGGLYKNYKKILPIWKQLTKAYKSFEKTAENENNLVLLNNRFDAVLHSSRNPVFRVNTKGEVTYVNPAWVEATGIQTSDALGFGYLKAIPKEDKGNILEQSQRLRDHPSAFYDEVRLMYVPTGEIKRYYCRSQIIRDKNTLIETIGWLYIL